jgi:hypothetical protein
LTRFPGPQISETRRVPRDVSPIRFGERNRWITENTKLMLWNTQIPIRTEHSPHRLRDVKLPFLSE